MHRTPLKLQRKTPQQEASRQLGASLVHTWQGSHPLRIDLHHVAQQVEVGVAQLWELEQLKAHQRNEDVNPHKHHLDNTQTKFFNEAGQT